ncbi:MAG: HAD family hydrolase [Chloroflexota bacterium]
MFDILAFDADDTLWHNEMLFVMTEEKFRALLEPYLTKEWTGEELYATEIRNLDYFGYGIKGFTLSMIETAIELTNARIPAHEVQSIIDFAKAMVKSPVNLLDHVTEVLPSLAQSHTLMLITKGDLFDQETKIARSGLAEHFTHIEIVAEKTADTYRRLLTKHQIEPQRFLMIGNSLRSDILPVVEVGGHAVHVPYQTTWAHETVSDQIAQQHTYAELVHLGLLPEFIAKFRS